MPKPIEADVRDALAIRNRSAALRQAFSHAWGALEEKYPDRAWWRRKSTRAAVIWEYAVNYAIDALADDAHVVSHNDTISFIFDDKVLVRLKKADVELMSKNYPTSSALLFHEPDADLFGYEGLQRVEVVYVLDQFGMSIDWIGIVARDGTNVIWNFELEEVVSTVEHLPLPSATTEESTAASLAKLKKVDSGGGKKSSGEK